MSGEVSVLRTVGCEREPCVVVMARGSGDAAAAPKGKSTKLEAVMQRPGGRRSGEVWAVFQAADADGGGTVDHGEVAAMCKKLGVRLTEEELAAAVRAMDADGNGTLTLAEVTADISNNTCGSRHHGERPQASRSKLLAKRLHGGGHGPGKKLNNVGEIWGRPPNLAKT